MRMRGRLRDRPTLFVLGRAHQMTGQGRLIAGARGASARGRHRAGWHNMMAESPDAVLKAMKDFLGNMTAASKPRITPAMAPSRTGPTA
jgi:hypothetical protein